MKQKLKNIKMETMLLQLQPILSHRDNVGYVAARNSRILSDSLTEYLAFKRELINKYGEVDRDDEGNDLGTISIKPNSQNFPAFTEEFNRIGLIEHEVELMDLKYDEVIGVLSGEEILKLDWMLTD